MKRRKPVADKHVDSTLAMMREHHIPLTRENYLALAFMGNPPDEPLDAELEASLPEQFQKNPIKWWDE
jgi:hypothetical protein